MKPYRDLFPHAGLMLSDTERAAEKVIVLPTGPSLPGESLSVIANVIRVSASL
jgi:dTDP-4-amino-4,6-dideoxygalactose transaminase